MFEKLPEYRGLRDAVTERNYDVFVSELSAFDTSELENAFGEAFIFSMIEKKNEDVLRYKEFLNKLLNHPLCNVNYQSKYDQYFPLFMAAKGNIHALSMLLSRTDICINLQSRIIKDTALHCAIWPPQKQAIKLLLDDERTDPSIQDLRGQTALYYLAFLVGQDSYRDFEGKIGFYQGILRTLISYPKIRKKWEYSYSQR